MLNNKNYYQKLNVTKKKYKFCFRLNKNIILKRLEFDN